MVISPSIGWWVQNDPDTRWVGYATAAGRMVGASFMALGVALGAPEEVGDSIGRPFGGARDGAKRTGWSSPGSVLTIGGCVLTLGLALADFLGQALIEPEAPAGMVEPYWTAAPVVLPGADGTAGGGLAVGGVF